MKKSIDTAVNILEKISKNNKDYVLITIAGGSGGGKTSFAKSLIQSLGADNCLLLHQDHFMHQENYNNSKLNSQYKWDDPSNYNSMELQKSILDLKAGVSSQVHQFCAFDSSQNQTVELHPKKYIILEGIYAYFYDALKDLTDLKIYVKDYYYARFFKRVLRDQKSRKVNPIKTIRNLLTSVALAHEDFVSYQLYSANIQAQAEDFDVQYYPELTSQSAMKKKSKNMKHVDSVIINDRITMKFYSIMGLIELWINVDETPLFVSQITGDMISQLKEVDWNRID